MTHSPCLIVGAGIAGLVAARKLENAGIPTLILEKSRGVGGRMATRRFHGATFDHGAQFFTARSAWFADEVAGWMHQGLVRRWSYGFPSETGEQSEDGHPRYRGHPGMTAVAKHLARGLDVRLEVRVEAIEKEGESWRIRVQDGQTFRADGLILTSPVPQSLAMLAAGGTILPELVEVELRAITYDPCLAGLVLLEQPGDLPELGAIQFSKGPVRWAADNWRKGVSPAAGAITLHASAGFSRQNWDAPDDQILAALLASMRAWLVGPVRAYQIQRWRYSQPAKVYESRGLPLAGPPPVVFAGDAFGGPRVEGAALSGKHAAAQLLSLLNNQAEA